MSARSIEYSPSTFDTPVSAIAKRDRDSEGMVRRCRPYQVGVALILLMNFGLFMQLGFRPYNRAYDLPTFLTVFVASLLALFMLFSLCARGRYTAAWLTVLLSPVVIGLFALQIGPMLGFLLPPRQHWY